MRTGADAQIGLVKPVRQVVTALRPQSRPVRALPEVFQMRPVSISLILALNLIPTSYAQDSAAERSFPHRARRADSRS